jgi:predicted O-methyltransferase YrrM
VSRSIDEALSATRDVEGWLSEDQALLLFESAATVCADGRIVEIGSFRGRSTIVLGYAAAENVEIVAIDPHAGSDRGPQEIRADQVHGDADREVFEANLREAGVAARVHHVRLRSDEALPQVPGPISMLYIDGAHRYGAARADIAHWGARVVPGGAMLIHDSFSSIGVTLAILRELAFGGNFVYEARVRSLARYRRMAPPLAGWARGRNALRQLAELGWFARNVAIKMAILVRLRRLAALLGQQAGDEWPY